MKKFLLLLILLFSITLISCGNSETVGGETSALSPIDTTVTIPETADDTTSPEQTTLSPETTSTPETTPETPEVTETTHTEETTIPDTAAPQLNVRIGYGENIVEHLTVHSAWNATGGTSGCYLIKTKEELDKWFESDEGFKPTDDLSATNELYPISLADTIQKFDETFFENNYLAIQGFYPYKWVKTEELVYAYINEKTNKIEIFVREERIGDPPSSDTSPHDNIYYWTFIFVEIPKNVCEGIELYSGQSLLHYYGRLVSPGYQLHFCINDDYYTTYGLQRLDQSTIDSLCNTPEFKEYLTIMKKCHQNYERVWELEEWASRLQWIEETLQKCK